MELENVDILASAALPVNQWATFAGFNRIGLYSNNCIFICPSEIQFYADTASGLLFTRKTEGRPTILLDDEPRDGYAKVTIGGVDYSIKLVDGGVDDDEIGVWHDVYSLDNITGFYK